MKNLKDILPNKKFTSGEIVKALRNNFNVSQNQLCDSIEISQTNLSALENNRRKLGLDIAMKLSIFFDVDPISLLYPNGIEKEIDEYKNIKRSAKKLVST